MPISVTTTDFERTLLGCVNRILTGVGEPEVGTISGQAGTVLKAIHAVNDAVEDIYTRGPWPFRIEWMAQTLTAGYMWYDLPDNFEQMATDFPLYLGVSELKYMEFTELLRRRPDFRHFPNSAPIDLSVLAQQSQMTTHVGEPQVYTLLGSQIGFFPIPNADYASQQSMLLAAYYKLPAAMVADGDLLDLPKNLWGAHYYLSLALLKQHYESRDFQADEARAERMIARQLGHKSQQGRTTRRFTPIVQGR